MREPRQIVRLWNEGGAVVLVTLVGVEGSSYRQPGARLLLGADGSYAGTISGGCLEAEVVRKAAWMVRAGAVMERYSTMFDDTSEVPFGLGCGGVVDLLLERTDTRECKALMTAMKAALRGKETTVLTWLPRDGRGLMRAVLAENAQVSFASDDLTELKLASMRHEVMEGRLCAGLSNGVFVERMVSPQRLFVLGASDDAKPIVSIAALLGWSVIVADGRSQLAQRFRFPEAEQVLTLTGLDALGIQPSDAVVLMTHSYEQDRELLAAILPIAPRYLGLLGARHRSSLLVSEAARLIGKSVADCCERIYAPVGLDLGGDGPEAIALAVVAEVQACCMGKRGSSRKLSPQDVARHVTQGGGERYLQVECALDET